MYIFDLDFQKGRIKLEVNSEWRELIEENKNHQALYEEGKLIKRTIIENIINNSTERIDLLLKNKIKV